MNCIDIVFPNSTFGSDISGGIEGEKSMEGLKWFEWEKPADNENC